MIDPTAPLFRHEEPREWMPNCELLFSGYIEHPRYGRREVVLWEREGMPCYALYVMQPRTTHVQAVDWVIHPYLFRTLIAVLQLSPAELGDMIRSAAPHSLVSIDAVRPELGLAAGISAGMEKYFSLVFGWLREDSVAILGVGGPVLGLLICTKYAPIHLFLSVAELELILALTKDAGFDYTIPSHGL